MAEGGEVLMTDALQLIQRAPDKIDRGVSLIIYAEAGQGKTTAAAKLPVGETLIVQIEAGYGPLLGTGHDLIDVKKAIANGSNVEDVITGIYRKLRTKELVYKNIVIDNMSELISCLLQHYTESRKKTLPEKGEFGDTSYKIMHWLSEWRDLNDLGVNVVFVSWEQNLEIQKSDGSVQTRTCPMLGRSTTFRACGLVDAVGRLEVIEETGERWLRFGPSRQYVTKCQFEGIITPENQVGYHEPNLNTVINKIKAYNYKERI